jgi:DNA-binding XRE family transcriptional regulator
MHHLELVTILKERREALGITQAHLAELADVSLRTLKALEVGKGNPTLETIAKLIEVLGMELSLEIKAPQRDKP